MRNGVSEFMAAERFKKSELGQALEGALNYEKFFKVGRPSLRPFHISYARALAVGAGREEACHGEHCLHVEEDV